MVRVSIRNVGCESRHLEFACWFGREVLIPACWRRAQASPSAVMLPSSSEMSYTQRRYVKPVRHVPQRHHGITGAGMSHTKPLLVPTLACYPGSHQVCP